MRLYFAAFFFLFFFVMQPRDPDRLLFYRSARLRGGVGDTSPLILWKLATLIKTVILIIYLKEKKEILSVVEPRLLRRCCGCTLPADPKPQCIFFPHNHRNYPERDYYKFVSNIRHFRAASLILNHRLKRSRFVAN